MEQGGASKQVRDLADGFSIQSKLANRLWLTLIVVAVLILLPDSSSDNSAMRELPFKLGKTDALVFDSISFFVLAIITIAFSSARAQALLAYDLAHKTIDNIKNDDSQTISQRQYFDILSNATLIRVGPLAVLARNENQTISIFYKTANIYYFVLKSFALSIYFGIPFVAIVFGWWSLCYNEQVSLKAKPCGYFINCLLQRG